MPQTTIDTDHIRDRLDSIDPETATDEDMTWLGRRHDHVVTVLGDLRGAKTSLHEAGYAFDFVPDEHREEFDDIKHELDPFIEEYDELAEELSETFQAVDEQLYGDGSSGTVGNEGDQ